MKLADYDISAERGFLASFEPARVALPEALHPIRDAALSLPHWLPSGRIRTLLERLPERGGVGAIGCHRHRRYRHPGAFSQPS